MGAKDSVKPDRGAETEQVQQVSIDQLHPFEGHPFKVLDDEAMAATVESVTVLGITTPLIVRPDPDGGFEIISYTGNVNKGTAKVTLKGTGSFGGTITRTFKIKANNVKENWFEKLARMLFH